jgi:1-acyl-sn-glycerol-3-phosphate acyltransferase
MLSAAASQIMAIAVLVVIGAGLVGWAAAAARKTRFTPGQLPLRALNVVYTRVVWRTTVRGAIDLPPGQGGVIICNHRGSLDPAFIGLVVDRMVPWMVAKEYWANPMLGWFFRTCQCIPVGRGGVDTAATKMAIRHATSGELVGMFPEGRINETDQLLLPSRPGFALVALKARVPVIPCYIQGAPYDGTVWGSLFMPAKVRLLIGNPIDLSPYYGREQDHEVLEMLAKRLLHEIAILAGHPEFEPQLAGRSWRNSGF